MEYKLPMLCQAQIGIKLIANTTTGLKWLKLLIRIQHEMGNERLAEGNGVENREAQK